MKFNLSTSHFLYNDKNKKRLEKLGFIFKKKPKAHHNDNSKKWYMDNYNMDGHIVIEINTLEELLEFQKEYKRLVIRENDEKELCLEIYDGYRE